MPKPRAEEGEFKGYPIITFYTGHEYQGKEEFVSMGLRKAQAVDDCICGQAYGRAKRGMNKIKYICPKCGDMYSNKCTCACGSKTVRMK